MLTGFVPAPLPPPRAFSAPSPAQGPWPNKTVYAATHTPYNISVKKSTNVKPPDVEKDRELLKTELERYLEDLKTDEIATDELAKLVTVLREIKKRRA